MTKLGLGITLSIPALLALAACPSDTQPKEAAATEVAPSDPASDKAAVIAAGEALCVEHACTSCHVEGADDPFAAPSLRGVDADSLLAFMDGTAPHSGGVVDAVTAEDAANLAAFLATQ